MWLDGVSDASHVHMEYHDFGTTTQIFVQRSSAGGETFSGALGAELLRRTEPSVGPPTGNIAGQIKVDNSSCSSHGKRPRLGGKKPSAVNSSVKHEENDYLVTPP